MPLFEFYCGECGVFEMVLGLSEIDEMIICPSCHSEVQRLFTPPSYYRPFSGIRHKVSKRAKKGREPLVVRKGEGNPMETILPGSHSQHNHNHGGRTGSPGYAPWMIKH